MPTWALGSEEWVGDDSEIARARRGDPAAFDLLLVRYQNRLFRYLLRLVGDPPLAEDLFQQTWLQVMTRLDRYDERRPFDPWLFSVARHLAIDHLRRTAPRSLDEPSPTGESKAERLPGREPGHLERILERERRSHLEQKLAELPALYREVLALRFEEEMTFDEISEVLGAPTSTVKSRVQRGLAMLRKKMSR
jgi:RNA polymerase sigma-70 factor, ECF subfamily